MSQLFAEQLSEVDLIILPEMFTSGFTQYPENSLLDTSTGNTTIGWMKQEAARYQAAVVGSVAYQKPSVGGAAEVVNRLLFVTPDQNVVFYDKCHLFTMGGEHERYKAGSERRVVNYKGWDILLTICYDLRFPVFCRNQDDYELMLCVANWPKVRRHPWRTLLQARAIENQAYVVGVNRVGCDGNSLVYQGDSMAIDYWGNPLVDGCDGREQILQTSLSKSDLLEARKSFPVGNDADAFKLL